MNENNQNNQQNINSTSQTNVNQNNINSNPYINNIQANMNMQKTVNNVQPSMNNQNNVNNVQPSMNNQNNVNSIQPNINNQNNVNNVQPSMNNQNNVNSIQPNINNQNNVNNVQPSMNNQNNVNSIQPNNNESVNKEQKKEYDLEIVDPLNPDNVIKTEKLIEKQENIEGEAEQNEPVVDTTKKKKGIKKFLPIIILSIIIIVALIVLIILNLKSDTPVNPNPTPSTPEIPDIEPVTFETIVDNFNNNALLNEIKGDGTIIASLANNKLNITVSPSDNSDALPTVYEFNLNNRNIEISLDDDNEKGLQLFLILCDSIYNSNTHEVYNYLSSIDLKTTTIDGITVTENNNEFLYSVNVDKRINTADLDNMYIEKTDLEEYREFIENSGSTRLTKGNLMLYKEGNDKTATIIIAEKEQLSNLTYQSILSVIDLLFEEELESFKTSYPNLETISFDRYNITIDPELTGTAKTLFEQYQDEYQFIEIKITL